MTAVLHTVAVVVIHTPIWVWGLYALLLYLGVQRSRDSIVPLWRVLILPVVVTGLTVSSFIVAGIGALPVMLAGLVVGGTAGWWLEPGDATRRRHDGTLWLRGEWWTLAQIVSVLTFRYASNVMPVLYPHLDTNAGWHAGVLFISAVLSALFLGRTAARLAIFVARAETA